MSSECEECLCSEWYERKALMEQDHTCNVYNIVLCLYRARLAKHSSKKCDEKIIDNRKETKQKKVYLNMKCFGFIFIGNVEIHIS